MKYVLALIALVILGCDCMAAVRFVLSSGGELQIVDGKVLVEEVPDPFVYPDFGDTILIAELDSTNEPQPDTSFIGTNDVIFPGGGVNPTFIVGTNTISGHYSWNGVNNRFDVTNDSFFNFGKDSSFTMGVWVKGEVFGGNDFMFSKREIAGDQSGYQFGIQSGGVAQFRLINDAATNLIVVTGDVPGLSDQWEWWVVSYDGSATAAGVKMYKNGVPMLTTTVSDTLTGATESSANLRLGNFSTFFYEGEMDRHIVWTNVVSASDLDVLNWNTSTNYGWMEQDRRDRSQFSNSIFVASCNYSSDGVGGMRDTSFVGTNNAPFVGGGNDPTFLSDGTNGYLSFNGTANYLDIENESNFDFDSFDPFSISMWINRVNAAGILFSKDPNTGIGRGYLMFISSGLFQFRLMNDFGAGNRVDVRATEPASNVWKHVAVTYDGNSNASGINIYYDGIVQPFTTNANALSGTTLNNISPEFGSRDNGTILFYSGLMDDMRVDGVELSSNQVFSAFNDSKEVHP